MCPSIIFLHRNDTQNGSNEHDTQQHLLDVPLVAKVIKLEKNLSGVAVGLLIDLILALSIRNRETKHSSC